jgi:2-keto-4-pentenoate hydratase/2-oxohepta-3-ene-1,7-dioic acid hydratase in catechol pathway
MPSIFCVGLNYAAHVTEMGSAFAAQGEMVVFLKPWQAIVKAPGPIRIPADATEIHHETEIVVRVGPDLAAEAITLGLDLTDRPRQSAAKKAGMPWTRAKGFRGAAPIGEFVPVRAAPPLNRLRFTLSVDGAVRQRGDTSLMLRPIPAILKDLDACFGLAPGDLVFTGTPEGIGPIAPGQTLALDLEGVPAASSRFVVAPR